MPFFSAFEGDRAIGFVALKIHNEYTIDMYTMGVLREYHRQGVGRAMLEAVEDYGRRNGFKFITVKTLEASAQYGSTNGPGHFILKAGSFRWRSFPSFGTRRTPAFSWQNTSVNIPSLCFMGPHYFKGRVGQVFAIDQAHGTARQPVAHSLLTLWMQVVMLTQVESRCHGGF